MRFYANRGTLGSVALIFRWAALVHRAAIKLF